VAAVGEQFVVVYSEGWREGGGLDDNGTGDGVYASAQEYPLFTMSRLPAAPWRAGDRLRLPGTELIALSHG